MRAAVTNGGSDGSVVVRAAGANRVVLAVVCAVRQGTVDAQGSATAAARVMVQVGSRQGWLRKRLGRVNTK